MAFKLILILLMCVLKIQGLYGQLPLTCTQRTNQLRTELNGLARNAGYDVSTTVFAINTNIALARFNIKTAKNDLQNKASSAAGPNAQLCKTKLESDLVSVDDASLNICYNSADVNPLNLKVSQINRMEESANLICRICLEDPTCVDTQIDNMRQQAQDLQQEVFLEAAAVQAKSIQCGEDAGNGQMEIIQTATDNFDTCIQAP
ncbi:hypothetical protein ILUMI_16173 [Ignelater luminosus]|uniref:Uncharacterized protein n=1 Tax=Ignelater luminosus TaxID=2038154 RepID=A0A8K0CMB9_IGNLU|nr:hypothetical protein ILUMI_16173 [Ignelater luminosus]